MLDLFYRFGSSPNWDGYCNLEVDKVVERQSTESDIEKRKRLVWEIERKLAEDGARPIIFYNRFAYCWQPQVKNWTMMVNSNITIFVWKTSGWTNSGPSCAGSIRKAIKG